MSRTFTCEFCGQHRWDNIPECPCQNKGHQEYEPYEPTIEDQEEMYSFFLESALRKKAIQILKKDRDEIHQK